MIEVRCFGTLKDAAFLREEVNALNLVGKRPDPFSTFEFFETFLAHDEGATEGRGLNLWFLTAFDAGQLVGYLALKQVTHRVFGMRASKLDFLVAHDADGPQLVARPEHALAVSAAFYAHILARQDEWTFLEFRQQDAASSLFPPPAAAELGGYSVRQWPGMDNGTIQVCWDTLDSYFSSLSKKFRSNVSRQMRSLLAAGNVEYLSSSDPAVTPALFELYQGIEQRSWKANAGPLIGRHALWADHFADLLAARQPMHVAMHILLLDGVPVAGLITGAFGAGLYALHIAFDESVSGLAPGSAMLLMGMRQAIEGRYAFLNLLSGFGYFKVRWRAQMSATQTAQIYRIGTPFFWHRVSGDLKRHVYPGTVENALTLFNPSRRSVIDDAANPAGEVARKPRLEARERGRIAALVASARHGRGEFLSATALAALMPFAAGPRA